LLKKIALKGNQGGYKLSLEQRYNQLKKEYETYQKLAESTIEKQSMKIIELDKKLDMVSLIVEISEYINRCLGSSEIDYLINDRTYFFYSVNKIIKDKDRPFAIVMIDIDDFKICNDTRGHQCGDAVLRKITKLIKDNLREEDICGRYGGEEIIIYMYGVKNIVNVYNRMEIIRKVIEETVTHHKNIQFKATVSMGIAIKEKEECLKQIIRRADVNLYKAKKLGKNRVIY